jgi:hypothetical protein
MDKNFENNQQLQRAASFCSDHTGPVSSNEKINMSEEMLMEEALDSIG